MHPVSRSIVVLAVSFLPACTEPPKESTVTAARVIGNSLFSGSLVANKSAANRLVSQKLAGCALSSSTFSVNLNSAGELLSTAAGRDVFANIIACALPSSVALEANIPDGTFEFMGDVGLAPSWLTQSLGSDGQRWVSSCLFSRVSAIDIAVAVSLRGPNPAIAADGEERAAFSLEEGGFFGLYFTPKDQAISWYACRGAAKALGDQGDLSNRHCAAPDPDHPGFTLCGFNYSGDCGAFALTHACEAFAEGGTYYQRCHPSAASKFPSGTPAFLQVITTYVMP